MGLGVFLARTIAERLGGALALESAPGHGTTATLLLPAGALLAEHAA
jgi:signal transduction histidine kinase